jgi:signal peptidase I
VAPAAEDRPAERRPDPWAAPRTTEQRGSDDFEAPRIWRAGSTGFESPDAAGREPESRATPEPSDLEPSEAVERDRDAVITSAVEDAAVAEATAAPVAEEPPAPAEPESEATPPPGTDLARRLAEANVRPPSEDFDRARGGAHDSENYDEPPPPRPSFRRAFRRFFDPSSASGSDSGTEEDDQGGLPETPAPAASDESGESFKAWLDRTAPVDTPDEPPAELAHVAGVPQSDSSPEHVSPDEPDAAAVALEASAAEPPSEPTDVAERVDEAAEEPAADGSHLRRNPLRRAAGWLFQPAPHPDGDEAQIDAAHGGAEANGLAADPDDAVPIEPLPFVEVPPRPLFFRPHTEAPAVPDQPAESPAASESADEPEFPPQPEPAEEPEPLPESEPADELEQREHVEHLAQHEEPGPPEVAAATILATPEPSEAELTATPSAPAAPESDDPDVAVPPLEPVVDPGTLRPGSDLPRRLAQANAEALARAEVRAPLVDAPVEARTEEREHSRRGAIALQERPGRTTEEAPSGGGTTGVLRTLGKNSLLRFLLTLALIVVLALLLRTYVISPYYIPSASMEQTLHGCTGCNNDHVLVNKLSYHLHPIHRGDVVVFHRPASWDVSDKVLIKRVIGMPGDVLTDRNGVVYINGDQLAEPYIDPQCTGGTLDLPRTVVPAGDLFVMGDDRCQSADSRSFGPIPKSTVIGRAFLIIWPLGRIHWL